MRARAQLLNENLLDLSHLTFLHPESIGSAEVAEIPVSTEARRRLRPRDAGDDRRGLAAVLHEGHGDLRADRPRSGRGVPPAELPRHARLGAARGQPGRRGAVRAQGHPLHHPRATHQRPLLLVRLRSYRVDDPEVDALWEQGGAMVFGQDTDACEAIEQVISAYEPSYPVELNMKVDAGPLRARRIVERMVRDEKAEATA